MDKSVITRSYAYLKRRQMYIDAARIRYIKKKLAEYDIKLFVSVEDAKEERPPTGMVQKKSQ